MTVGLEINKQPFWYALYERSEPILDEAGQQIGQKPIYGHPIPYRANISPARGATQKNLFGINAEYSRVLNPLPLDFPMDELSILWIDRKPEIKPDGSTDTGHDYIVTEIAKSLNHKAYTVYRVNVADGRAGS